MRNQLIARGPCCAAICCESAICRSESFCLSTRMPESTMFSGLSAPLLSTFRKNCVGTPCGSYGASPVIQVNVTQFALKPSNE